MKLLEQMSDDELLAEITRLNSIPVPKERRPGQPPRKRDAKPKASRKASWKDVIFDDLDKSSEGG